MAKKETDTFYILWAGALVFVMQCGFATLEAGSVREKNVRNVLLKNALDADAAAPSPSPVRPPMPPLKKTKKDIKDYFNKK